MTRRENILWFTGSAVATIAILVASGLPYAQRNNAGQWMLVAGFLLTAFMSIIVHDTLAYYHKPDDADQDQERERL